MAGRMGLDEEQVMTGDARRHVWIVEGSYELRGQFGPWHPTVGVALTRVDGRHTVRNWKRLNPCDRFRLRKYTRGR